MDDDTAPAQRSDPGPALQELLREQDGVASRRQLLGLDLREHDVARLVRRRELVRVHPRVYVDHTGTLSWSQRAWAAVLWAEPAALSHDSAVRWGDGSARRGGPDLERSAIHVAVAWQRHLPGRPGITVHRTRHLEARMQPLAPPRIRLEEALLDVAAGSTDEIDVVARLADACGARRTTAQRLRDAAADRVWLPHRALVVSLLDDIAGGTCSALEQLYLDRVVRAHGLPEGRRQAAHRHLADQRYRDVLLEEHDTVVELDGRAHHGSTSQRDADLDRDLDAAALDDLLTVRLGWGQCTQHACRTADRLGALLARRGWTGTMTGCTRCRAAA